MNRHALASGLANLWEIGQVLPKARRVAILNDVHADFMAHDPFLARRLEEARGEGKPIETLRLPRCNAPAWGYAQNYGTLPQIASLDPQELIALGLLEGPVRRSMAIIAKWIANAVAQVETLLPPAEKPSKRSAK